MTVKETLQRALSLFGPNGENWIKGFNEDPDKHCMATAVGKATEFTNVKNSLEALQNEVQKITGSHSVISFNDAYKTEFADVKNVFEKAIEAQP